MRGRIKRGENAAKEKRLGTQWSGRLIVPGGMTHKVPDRAPDPIIYRCQKARRPARISYPDPQLPVIPGYMRKR